LPILDAVYTEEDLGLAKTAAVAYVRMPCPKKGQWLWGHKVGLLARVSTKVNTIEREHPQLSK
jgi:hypothetical protein